MKKSNVKTTATKQRKQVASKARRKRRLAARDVVVQRKLRPLAKIIQAQEKQIDDLTKRLGKAADQFVAAHTEPQEVAE